MLAMKERNINADEAAIVDNNETGPFEDKNYNKHKKNPNIFLKNRDFKYLCLILYQKLFFIFKF